MLTTADTNGLRDVYVHDRDLDTDGVMDEPGAIATRRVSVTSSGAQAIGGDSVDASHHGRWPLRGLRLGRDHARGR